MPLPSVSIKAGGASAYPFDAVKEKIVAASVTSRPTNVAPSAVPGPSASEGIVTTISGAGSVSNWVMMGPGKRT